MAALDQNNINGLLADEMGMGKTIMTISFICYLHETGKSQKRPHMIIGPKSTIPNWMKEFRVWAPQLRVVNLLADKENRDRIIREEMKPGTFDVCVTTYEALQYVTDLFNDNK